MASEEPSTSTGVTKAKKRKPAKSDWTWEDEMLMYDVVHRDKVIEKTASPTFPVWISRNSFAFLGQETAQG